MSDDKPINLLKAAKELNIGLSTVVDYLNSKGYTVENKPNTKLSGEMYDMLSKEFLGDKMTREQAKKIEIGKIRREETPVEKPQPKPQEKETKEILIKQNVEEKPRVTEVESTPVIAEKPQAPVGEIKTVSPETDNAGDKPGVKVVGKIDLDALHKKGNRTDKPEKKAPEPEVKKAEAVVAPEIPKPKEEIKTAEVSTPKPASPKEAPKKEPVETPKQVAKPVVEAPKPTTVVTPPVAPPVKEEKVDDVIRARSVRLTGPNVVGKITLPVTPERSKHQPVASSSDADHKRKRKRKKTGDQPNTNTNNTNTTPGSGNANHPNRTGGGNHPNRTGGGNTNHPNNRFNKGKGGNHHVKKDVPKEEPTDKEIQDQIKATLARLSGAGKSGKFAQRSKFRRQKRDDIAQSAEEAALQEELESKVLKVTEFVTANELASMIDEPVTKVISTCMSLGMFVSINQRLDAETLTIVAEEFGYEIQFVKPEDEENVVMEEDDSDEDLIFRSPIVTVMGHVDHGKTSLLDFVRRANVVAGEAGGITQHIGAYEVKLPNGKKITFLDTPGHEAFTAMRARGAKITDIAIIVIAADDSVMPQTKEAINHAQAAGVPIVFAFTKIDKPGANTERIREQLATMNLLVEDWGGKYQSQEISGKSGLNVDLLLEKVLLEAELLDLKANPHKRATGTVIEAALDKGRGIVTTVLVQAGTLRVGDPVLAGAYSGRVKALFNERGQKVDAAGPSAPVLVLGMQGAPTAGDKFNAMESESEARDIANKRLQLIREQGIKTQKHITLDEIGRRLALGNFKELKIIVKGDVDGSIEALSDSLLKLSTEEIQINIISKGVGQISESDVLLATASDAIIIGFQVRPSAGARKLAEQEKIDIRLYSIIYDAINEIKAAMEGMLAPEFEEKIVANVEIRETFKISKVGTIAGCMVLDGKITRNSKVRIVRDGVVIYTGELASLKRFKDDVKEVTKGYECGLNIQNFNNIEVGDIVEAYENVEIKRKL